MKILFFIDAFSSGGKERRLIELMKGLKQVPDINFELVIMSKNIQYKELFDLDITVHYIIRKTKKDLSVFRKVYKLCKERKPDIVHCWDSMTAVYLIPALKMLKMKLVNGMIVDAPAKQNVLNRNWLRGKLTFPFSSIIVGNSQAGLTAYNAPREKSVCIHNGFNFQRTENMVDADTIRKQLEVKNHLVVGMVASFSVYKDYATYFAAAQLILKERKDVVFLAVGNDTDSKAAAALILEENQSHFRLLGKKTDVESYINIMDICVLATFTEGISNSILEYMSLGKPVIATDGGGTKEIVADKKTGFLIKPSNPTDLAEKMETLLNNSRLREKMGTEGLSRVENNFSIAKMVEGFIYTYKELIE